MVTHVLHPLKYNDSHDPKSGKFTSGGGGGEASDSHFDVHSQSDMEAVSQETGGSRVFDFSQGEGSDLDRNVKFATNTNKDGMFERGKLRIEIHDQNTQTREIHERPMTMLPKLVGQVLAKKYEPISQHQRKPSQVMKSEEVHGAT